MKLSIVTTLYKSEPYILEFCQRSQKIGSNLFGNDYEIILVNDGSPDNSLQASVELAKFFPNLKIIDLSRNFGHHKAMMTGLEFAKGDLIFLIDSDLEEEPEWLAPFYQTLQSTNSDVVFGVQKRRKGKFFERVSGIMFYKLYRFLTGINLPENLVTARLMTARYVRSLLLHKEAEIMIAGLWLITGYKQTPYAIVKYSTSATTYTVKTKLMNVVTSITAFSKRPLEIIFFFGMGMFLLSLVNMLYLFVNWFFLSTPLTGWTSVMASIWILGGLITSFVGIIGLYISKIYSEVKQRPYTIVRETYSSVKNAEVEFKNEME